MFDIKHLDGFYQFDSLANTNETPIDVSDETKKAYFVFINEFCVCISSSWKQYLKELCINHDTASFVQHLTRSDEAYTYWLLSCLYKKCVADAKDVKTEGWDKWNQDRKKGKAGKHDSTTKFDDYVTIYNKISALRENEKAYNFWQKIFFDHFFDKLDQKQSGSNEVIDKKQKKNDVSISIPLDFD